MILDYKEVEKNVDEILETVKKMRTAELENNLDERVTTVETKYDKLDGRIDSVNGQAMSLQTRVEVHNCKLGEHLAMIRDMNDKLNKLSEKECACNAEVEKEEVSKECEHDRITPVQYPDWPLRWILKETMTSGVRPICVYYCPDCGKKLEG